MAIRGQLAALQRKEGGGEAARATNEVADKAPLDSCEMRDVAKAGVLPSGTSTRASVSQPRRQVEHEPLIPRLQHFQEGILAKPAKVHRGVKPCQGARVGRSAVKTR